MAPFENTQPLLLARAYAEIVCCAPFGPSAFVSFQVRPLTRFFVCFCFVYRCLPSFDRIGPFLPLYFVRRLAHSVPFRIYYFFLPFLKLICCCSIIIVFYSVDVVCLLAAPPSLFFTLVYFSTLPSASLCPLCSRRIANKQNTDTHRYRTFPVTIALL